ncbi:hypothetical protein D3C73_889020 [compost metagenome]
MSKLVRCLLSFVILFGTVVFLSKDQSFAVASLDGGENSNTIYFTIPLNSFCSKSQVMDLSLNVTSLTNNAELSIHLFKKNGEEINTQGTSYDGIESEIIPGAPTTVKKDTTVVYHLAYGGMYENCSERVYYGKIVSNTTGSSILAGGWVDGAKGNATILINNGEPWTNKSCNSSGEGNDLVPTMTSNFTPCGQVSASTEFSSLNAAWTAFNDTIESSGRGWHTEKNITSGWLEYAFHSPQVVRAYTLQTQNSPNNTVSVARAPKTWTFEAWNGQEWIVLDSQNNITNWVYSESKKFSFTNEKAYSKYRINITANNGSVEHIVIGEMQLLPN